MYLFILMHCALRPFDRLRVNFAQGDNTGYLVSAKIVSISNVIPRNEAMKQSLPLKPGFRNFLKLDFRQFPDLSIFIYFELYFMLNTTY